jgi:serine-threonine kinase receptor-associated protein
MSVLAHNHIVKAVAFPIQRNPQVVATAGAEKKLRIWDLTRATALPSDANEDTPRTATNISDGLEIGAGDHTASIKSVVWNVDYNIITTAADDKTLRWYDLRTPGTIATFTTDHDIKSCELSTNQSDDANPGIMSVAAGQTAYFFDGGRPGQLFKQVDFDHGIASVGIYQPTGRFVTGGSNDTWVRVWDLEPEKQLGMLATTCAGYANMSQTC